MNAALDTLVTARTLISHPMHWGINNLFMDANGNSCVQEEAKSYCAIGALIAAKSTFESHNAALRLLLQAVWEAEGTSANRSTVAVPLYNNTHTHEEVLAVFDRAIELAGGKCDPKPVEVSLKEKEETCV